MAPENSSNFVGGASSRSFIETYLWRKWIESGRTQCFQLVKLRKHADGVAWDGRGKLWHLDIFWRVSERLFWCEPVVNWCWNLWEALIPGARWFRMWDSVAFFVIMFLSDVALAHRTKIQEQNNIGLQTTVTHLNPRNPWTPTDTMEDGTAKRATTFWMVNLQDRFQEGILWSSCPCWVFVHHHKHHWSSPSSSASPTQWPWPLPLPSGSFSSSSFSSSLPHYHRRHDFHWKHHRRCIIHD